MGQQRERTHAPVETAKPHRAPPTAAVAAPVVQRYPVALPAKASCTELFTWLTTKGPYLNHPQGRAEALTKTPVVYRLRKPDVAGTAPDFTVAFPNATAKIEGGTTDLPQFKPTDSEAASVWAGHIAALSAHEESHKKVGEQYAGLMEDDLRSHSEQPTAKTPAAAAKAAEPAFHEKARDWIDNQLAAAHARLDPYLAPWTCKGATVQPLLTSPTVQRSTGAGPKGTCGGACACAPCRDRDRDREEATGTANRGPATDPLLLLQRSPLQRSPLTVQRKSDLDTAVDNRDPALIDKLDTAVLQTAPHDKKVALIGIIVEKGSPLWRLELLWNNVPDPVVEANIGLWQTTWQNHASSMGNHARRKLFEFDVADVADDMLAESLAACEAYLKQYGLSADAENAGVSTPERAESLDAVGKAATEVLGAQKTLQDLRQVPIEVERYNSKTDSIALRTTGFAPGSAPADATTKGADTWQKTNKAYVEVTKGIDAYLEAVPELYPIVMVGSSSKQGAYEGSDRTKEAVANPLKMIEQSLQDTIKNIKDTRGGTVAILARDRKLAPVEQQLTSGSRTAPKAGTRNWQSNPIFAAMVPSITAPAGLGSTVAEIAVLTAVNIALAATTGPIGPALLGAAQVALSEAERAALQTASDTSIDAEGAIVDKQQVAAANLSVALDLAFLALDVVPGVKAARGVWAAARQDAKTAAEAAVKLQAQALEYEAKLVAKAQQAEVEAIERAMKENLDKAQKASSDVAEKAKSAPDAEKVLVEAEARKAAEAVKRGETAVTSTKKLASGEVLETAVGGRRYSWVPGRGMVVCGSACASAVDKLKELAEELMPQATKHSPDAAKYLQARCYSAQRHVAQLETAIRGKTLTKPELDQFAAHANGLMDELKEQLEWTKVRFPGGNVLSGPDWAKAVNTRIAKRRADIEVTSRAFLGASNPPAEVDRVVKIYKDELAKNLDQTLKKVEREATAAKPDPTNRATLMQELDTAMLSAEREIRGQRALAIEGANVLVRSDTEAAGFLKSTGTRTDYLATKGNKLIIGDSKGAGGVDKGLQQLRDAESSPGVKKHLADNPGVKVELRIYLSMAEAKAAGYRAIGNPPVLHVRNVDGAYVPVSVNGKPVYLYRN